MASSPLSHDSERRWLLGRPRGSLGPFGLIADRTAGEEAGYELVEVVPVQPAGGRSEEQGRPCGAHRFPVLTCPACELAVGRSCDVTDEMVEAGAAGLRKWDNAVLADSRYRPVARAVLEAALGASADKEAHGGK
jgi:hypothetical protein